MDFDHMCVYIMYYIFSMYVYNLHIIWYDTQYNLQCLFLVFQIIIYLIYIHIYIYCRASTITFRGRRRRWTRPPSVARLWWGARLEQAGPGDITYIYIYNTNIDIMCIYIYAYIQCQLGSGSLLQNQVPLAPLAKQADTPFCTTKLRLSTAVS